MAIKSYQEIPIEIITIKMEGALEISHGFNIYAYDAYMLECAAESKSSLLTPWTDILLRSLKK